MATFDFVHVSAYRRSLEEDYGEFTRCLDVHAWKAVHVLGGSIIEAVLTDFLVWSKPTGMTPEVILAMPLGQLISACKKAGVLSQKTVALTDAIKEYRNLIHPGREQRLGERADENGAVVVKALLEMVVAEVAQQKQEKYGYTAEQLLKKIESDSSVVPLLKHFRRETKDGELARLLSALMPDRIEKLGSEDVVDWPLVTHLSVCFRELIRLAPSSTHEQVCELFVRVLKEEPEAVVDVYADYMLHASDIQFMEEPSQQLTREFLLARIQKDVADYDFEERYSGIGAYLRPEDASRYIDALVKAVTSGDAVKQKNARGLFDGEYENTKLDVDKKLLDRLNVWEKHYHSRGDAANAALMAEMRAEYELPF